ncbi:MAG: hypothetical protein KDC18_20150 [Alphaproteobacteria bacterium]|nr:hypothetical protein [Alphaproteobacteria bacterium]
MLLAQGYGYHGMCITRTEEFEPALLAALDAGALDDVSPAQVALVRERIATALDAKASDLVGAIATGQKLDDAALARLAALTADLATTVGTPHGG